MNGYFAFLQKEFLEHVRTYKMLILALVFFAFGVMSPLTAKMTPALLSSLMPEVVVAIADPVAADSWVQFFKNISQMGLIVVVILFSGILATELSKGTLIHLLAKGLSRNAVILSKYTGMALLWTASLMLSFFVTRGYTAYLFPHGEAAHLPFAVFCLWLFGMFLLALLLFGSVLTASPYGCLLITGAALVLCLLFNLIPGANRYNPLALATKNMELVSLKIEVPSLYWAIGITGALSCLLLTLSVLMFKRKQL